MYVGCVPQYPTSQVFSLNLELLVFYLRENNFLFLFVTPINDQRLTQLEEALCRADTSQPSIISAIIDKFSQTPILHEQSAYNRCDSIFDLLFFP